MLQTYEDAHRFLNSFLDYEKLLSGSISYDTKSFDLENFREILRSLGDPHLKGNVIHVAGTKGKGSTCAFLGEILRAAGYRTGSYTSPHIYKYTERIAINSKPISDGRFCDLLQRISPFVRDCQPEGKASFRTLFELLTSAAFVYFAEEKVDVAMIETGLGGRLDATNVFDAKPHNGGFLVNVITAIGFDHTSILGNTISKIGQEKAGILRPHAIAVLGEQPPQWRAEVAELVKDRLTRIGARQPFEAGEWLSAEDVGHTETNSSAKFRLDSQRFQEWAEVALPRWSDRTGLIEGLNSGLELRLGLPGKHQVQNMKAVLAALIAASASGLEIPPDAVIAGAQATRQAGRFEVFSTSPLLVIDGAHCALSAEALADTFLEAFGHRNVIAVAGFMRDKAAAEIVGRVVAKLKIDAFICCTPPSPRALPAAETAKIVKSALETPVAIVEDCRHAIGLALAQVRKDQAVLVFGSMFLIGPAKEAAGTLLSGQIIPL